jgi:eukaryotic-like serine/threonine-protein kinase
MTGELTCPEERELGLLLLGRIDDDRERVLLDHLARCDRCAACASSLHAEDDLVATMRERSPILAEQQGSIDTIIERAREGVLAARPDLAPRPATADLPGEVGPYQVLKLLGSGGMGVVYLARHRELRRLVALKLISQGEWGNESRRLRFRREAELVARVRHPNVVTLYEVGEWQGAPYFAMEYVEGGNLAESLAESPMPPRRAADVVAILARAVHFAHENGVVHRDLKPANVLLSSAEAAPKVTDFGLARQLDDEQGHTRPGDVMGTPSYMAPEQIDRVSDAGPPADVYGLGAILYECLTGRPPFKGATPLATLEQVRYAEPVAPGQLQPGLPRDLQVITLKCLEKAPARRYPSALALADDLRRWLEGQPIVARPGGIGERVLKWARRRPALAALVTVIALALGVVAGGAVVYERRLRQELGNTARALGQAKAEGERADGNSQKARDAIKKMVFRTTQRGWNEVPRLRRLRRGLLEEALAFYEQIAAQEGDNPAVRHDVAWASLEAGKFQAKLGRADESRASVERAVTLASALTREQPDSVGVRLLHADALAFLGAAHHVGARAIELQEEAAGELEALRKAAPNAPGVRGQLARTLGSLGATYMNCGRPGDALRRLERAQELNRQLADERPDDPGQREQLARTRLNLAQACYALKQQERGHRAQELAEADFEAAHAGDPHNLEVVEAFAQLRVNRSYVFAGAGQFGEAAQYLSRNVPMLGQALKLDPDDPLLRDRLYRTYALRSGFEDRLGRAADAVASREKAIEYEAEANRVLNRALLAVLRAKTGDYRKAIALADALRDEVARKPEAITWKQVGGCYSLIEEVAGKDAKLPTEERRKIQAHCSSEVQSASWKAVAAEGLKLFQKKPPAGVEKR